MKISQNCIDLIKKWEGFRSQAYLDPVDIPTIGYGTIRYPNGQKVKMGDTVTEQEAETYLLFECDRIAREVSGLVSVALNQNQFDALGSFCYNIGIGAFTESTLRKKLNSGDSAGATNEFSKWVYGTVSGVKTVLPGLVSRRTEEKALFEKLGVEGTPIEVEESPQDKVTWLEGYRDGASNVIVARAGNDVIEILRLESPLKEDLFTVLQRYPNAQNFHIAPLSSLIPGGVQIPVSTKRPIAKTSNPPVLNRPLLVRGMDDSEASGEDIKELQRRLRDLGYYSGAINGIFDKDVDEAVKDFQTDYFGQAQADGKVGSKTWGKLWGDSQPRTSIPTAAGKTYLRLTKTNRHDIYGCYVLILEYIKNGIVIGGLEVCSGTPRNQLFRIGSESKVGSGEPLPEGKWYVHDIRWAGGKDNYDGPIFAEGEGPVKVPLDYKAPGTTQRSAILFHIDWNRRKGYPGTVGCIGIYSIADFKTLVSWLRDTDPRNLYVDWDLGTCPAP